MKDSESSLGIIVHISRHVSLGFLFHEKCTKNRAKRNDVLALPQISSMALYKLLKLNSVSFPASKMSCPLRGAGVSTYGLYLVVSVSFPVSS